VTTQNRFYPDMSNVNINGGREIPCDYTKPVLLDMSNVNINGGREIPCDYTEPVLSRYV